MELLNEEVTIRRVYRLDRPMTAREAMEAHGTPQGCKFSVALVNAGLVNPDERPKRGALVRVTEVRTLTQEL